MRGGRAVALAVTLACLAPLGARAAETTAAPAQSGLTRTESAGRGAEDNGVRGLFLGGGGQRGPINIDARRFEVDNKRRTATYSEQVVARQDDMTLTADRLTVLFDDARRISQVTAEGNVKMVQKTPPAPGAPAADREAACSRVVFAVPEDRIVCTGGPASMRQGDDLIRGSRITVFVADERIVVEGDTGSPRVTSRITPKPEKGQAGTARPN